MSYPYKIGVQRFSVPNPKEPFMEKFPEFSKNGGEFMCRNFKTLKISHQTHSFYSTHLSPLLHHQEQHTKLSTASLKEEKIISLATTTTTGWTPVVGTTRQKALAHCTAEPPPDRIEVSSCSHSGM